MNFALSGAGPQADAPMVPAPSGQLGGAERQAQHHRAAHAST